jgi:uncharacterized protein (DUF58 family)
MGALCIAFFGIARTTGAGWVVVLICSIVGCLVVALAGPLASIGRVKVSVVAPRDGTVGRPLVMELAVPRGGFGLKVRATDPRGEWTTVEPPAVGEVVVTPVRRGVFQQVEVEVEAGGPLGLVRWRRRLGVPLPVPMEVAPRPIDESVPADHSRGSQGLATEARGRLGQDLVRGVRDYRPGDPIRVVHWPATARWGRLMVKELEDPELPALTVVVDLRGPPNLAEDVASRAAGLLASALAEGMRVTLVTAERHGGVVGEVGSTLDGGRRLARAVGGPPPEEAATPGSVVVRLSPSTAASAS